MCQVFKSSGTSLTSSGTSFQNPGRRFQPLADLFDGKQLLSSGGRERVGFDGMFLLLLALPRLDLRCSSATVARKRLPQFIKLPFRVHLGRKTLDDPQDDRRETVVVGGPIPGNRSNDGHIPTVGRAAETIRQQVQCQSLDELIGALRIVSEAGRRKHRAKPHRST
jgi:hypothetical protein